MINIVKRRYLFFGISILLIVPGLIALAVWRLPLAIDFKGGTLLEIQFDGTTAPQTEDIVTLYENLNVSQPIVQTSGPDIFVIRSTELDAGTVNNIVDTLGTQNGGTVTILRVESVGPAVGKEVATRAAGAVGLATIGILLYITYSFRGVPHAFRYGIAAIIAMLHDVLVVIGFEAILGKFLGWEVDALFLTALLTVIGFSVHDTIVVFDRIRENSGIYRRSSYETVVNTSIVQTLARSINTQLTVAFTLVALALFGGITIRHFVVILLIGVLSGTYSSIFNAAPILVVWENKEWRNWFRSRTKESPAQ